jgi:hypothetical protein
MTNLQNDDDIVDFRYTFGQTKRCEFFLINTRVFLKVGETRAPVAERLITRIDFEAEESL